MQIMTQLAFGGQCRQAFDFYETVLGGRVSVMNTFGDIAAKLPPGSTASAPDEIRFAELRIVDFAILSNDLPQDEFAPIQGFHLALHLKTGDEACCVFEALSEGGVVETPLSEVACSSAFGTVTDRFGTPWLILALDK